MTAFDELVLPAVNAFAPDMILISAGFDAAEGDPLRGYHLTPEGYAHMTRRLQAVPSSQGRVVVVLEGGYNLESISSSASAVCKTLRGAETEPLTIRPPKKTAVNTVGHALAVHRANGLLAGKETEGEEERREPADPGDGAQAARGSAVSTNPAPPAEPARARSRSPARAQGDAIAPLAGSAARRGSGAGRGRGRGKAGSFRAVANVAAASKRAARREGGRPGGRTT